MRNADLIPRPIPADVCPASIAGMDPLDVGHCDVCGHGYHEDVLVPIPAFDEVICPDCAAEMRAEIEGEVVA